MRIHADPLAVGATIGILFSVFSLMQFIFSPMGGRISDRIGRRPVLISGLALYLVSGLACALTPNLDWLLLTKRIGNVRDMMRRSVESCRSTRQPQARSMRPDSTGSRSCATATFSTSSCRR